jgi:SAM-dependent methyltransferase
LKEYRLVRTHEAWGAADASYYRALPRVADDDPQRRIWRIREKNFDRLLHLMSNAMPQTILDIGAGNGWLSNQLARRGHRVAAVDLLDDARDGLGAWPYYVTGFACYQAEFDRLPFDGEQFDWVVFNAALHYSTDLRVTLGEARRVTRPGGRIVVMDSPFYAEASSGVAMVAERESDFARTFGFEQGSRTIGFLTEAELRCAAREVGLSMRVWEFDMGWIASLRRAWTRFRIRREPAHMPIVIMET